MVRDSRGKWIDTTKFREAAIFFKENGYYVAAPPDSAEWFDYWYEQKKRCIEGYTVEGQSITGDHYFYLNFCPIQKVDITSNRKTAIKIQGFPDFWDGDYDYFWVRELVRNSCRSLAKDKEWYDSLEGVNLTKENRRFLKRLKLGVEFDQRALLEDYDLAVGKSRRKGYSYKNAAIAAKNYFCFPNSLTLLVAEDKKYLYPDGLFSKAIDYINFINDNTGWTMPSDVVNKADHRKASYYEYKDGVKIEKGFLSEIQALTANDNPDCTRGKDAYDVFMEESGAFGSPGLLKDLIAATYDTVRAGSVKTGLITLFGTSGQLTSGTADYADICLRPRAFKFFPFKNTWDEGYENTECCFFHSTTKNTEGFYDKQGNSDEKGAREYELKERERLVDNGATSVDIQKRLQERPFGPIEAFGAVSKNIFPVLELKAQYAKVKTNNWQFSKGTSVELQYDGKEVIAIPMLGQASRAITSYTNVPEDIRGQVIIYEYPVGNAPFGLYKIGYDPVRQDTGTSLAAIIVYKGAVANSFTKENIVAEYVGRMETPDMMDELALKLAILYNTQVMHENEVTSVKNYFRRVKMLGRLAVQPDAVISKNIKNSKVARVFGCHMNEALKDAGERYVLEWLLRIQDYDENGDPIRTLDTIYSLRLLEELIYYTRKGNFDLVSSLFMCLIHAQEALLDQEYDLEEIPTIEHKFDKLIALRN